MDDEELLEMVEDDEVWHDEFNTAHAILALVHQTDYRKVGDSLSVDDCFIRNEYGMGQIASQWNMLYDRHTNLPSLALIPLSAIDSHVLAYEEYPGPHLTKPTNNTVWVVDPYKTWKDVFLNPDFM